MSLSMLEQIALRFELYASDQDACLRKGLVGSIQAKRNAALSAKLWRDAAKELRKIGADNRDAFAADVKLSLLMAGDPASDIVALFITPPIPAPTPRDHVQQIGRATRLAAVLPTVFDEPDVAHKLRVDRAMTAGAVTARLKGPGADD